MSLRTRLAIARAGAAEPDAGVHAFVVHPRPQAGDVPIRLGAHMVRGRVLREPPTLRAAQALVGRRVQGVETGTTVRDLGFPYAFYNGAETSHELANHAASRLCATCTILCGAVLFSRHALELE